VTKSIVVIARIGWLKVVAVSSARVLSIRTCLRVVILGDSVSGGGNLPSKSV
jgi:hypothetical protein